jgi:hypothetical protein
MYMDGGFLVATRHDEPVRLLAACGAEVTFVVNK